MEKRKKQKKKAGFSETRKKTTIKKGRRGTLKVKLRLMFIIEKPQVIMLIIMIIIMIRLRIYKSWPGWRIFFFF